MPEFDELVLLLQFQFGEVVFGMEFALEEAFFLFEVSEVTIVELFECVTA